VFFKETNTKHAYFEKTQAIVELTSYLLRNKKLRIFFLKKR
jgi:hypothetical protein